MLPKPNRFAIEICTSKKQYSLVAAANVCSRAYLTRKVVLRPYLCPTCDRWHVTSKSVGEYEARARLFKEQEKMFNEAKQEPIYKTPPPPEVLTPVQEALATAVKSTLGLKEEKPIPQIPKLASAPEPVKPKPTAAQRERAHAYDNGRPVVAPEKRRLAVSVSFDPRILALARKSPNASQWLERRVLFVERFLQLYARYERRQLKILPFLREVKKLVRAWEKDE